MMLDKNRRRQRLLLTGAAGLMMAFGTFTAAHAQSSTAVLGEGGPRDQQRARQRPGSAATPRENELTPKLRRESVQRLEAGALLCKTEADLQQHETAVQARLNGGEAAEPRGCRLVQAMMSVSVIQRHGLNRTEVMAGDQHGWTDTMIRNP
jgi:hypothetical protein